GAAYVRLGNNFHQWHTRSVEIHAAEPVEMEVLADVFFEVRPGDANPGDAAVEFEIDMPANRRWLVVLRDLVVFRHVRIEVVLPIEFGMSRYRAVEKKTGQSGQAQGLLVRDGQNAGKAEAHRADVGVWRRAELIGTTAPHFGLGF